MKKHSTAAQVRRKTTREERRRSNVKNTQRISNNSSKNNFRELETLYNDCRSLLSQPAGIGTILKQDVVKNNLGDKTSVVTELATQLVKDVGGYLTQLDAIHQKHAGKDYDINDPDSGMIMIGIAMEYQNWIDSFQSVVLPNSATIIAVINSALSEEQRAQLSTQTV